MSDRKALARQLLGERAVLDELAARVAVTDKEARDAYASGDADSVETDAGVDLGRVARDRASLIAEVDQNEAFLEWVKLNHPEHLESVSYRTATPEAMEWLAQNHPEWVVEVVEDERVAPAYVKAIESKLTKARGEWTETYVDPATGEESKARPPWLRVGKKQGAFRVAPSEEATAAARELLDTQLAALGGSLPELPAVYDDAGGPEMYEPPAFHPGNVSGPEFCPLMWTTPDQPRVAHHCAVRVDMPHDRIGDVPPVRRHVCLCGASFELAEEVAEP